MSREDYVKGSVPNQTYYDLCEKRKLRNALQRIELLEDRVDSPEDKMIAHHAKIELQSVLNAGE